ncbi:hypothetical protein QWY75_05525 [Pontixanthobacter aestiaquae]|uniref:Uncharacterized protein n=1 Tax=Pontixanthobacter aestiaquae TaxID=1509367 RepID=A0A844Z8E0_9SPHN|nr:hypothetical protein [Pontixanthobacter aestiaquae]MDN3645665.1 hypothetical protein [Pontixanthobacter aestiaquae]MXO83337.1 hypothetical protein [Pontixanthobacter aestiaquae]
MEHGPVMENLGMPQEWRIAKNLKEIGQHHPVTLPRDTIGRKVWITCGCGAFP